MPSVRGLVRRIHLALWTLVMLVGCRPGDSPAPEAPSARPVPQDAPVRPAPPAPDPWDAVDDAVHASIERGELSGAVVVILRGGELALRRAYGHRIAAPAEEAFSPNALFDLASLTKCIATAPSILLLAEQGKLRLSDPVARYLPSFNNGDKAQITIEELLLHTSGLPASSPLRFFRKGLDEAVTHIASLDLAYAPGTGFTYSDMGYIVLGALVERISGEPLDRFARKRLFAPLGMADTGFNPSPALAARAAPTAPRAQGGFFQGTVHDPHARSLGGVAGHAGLFSTADDLTRFAKMLLNEGELEGRRVLAAQTVRKMTAKHVLPKGGERGLGWDIRTGYSHNRGKLPGGYGHTGFTGPSIWIEPASKSAVIVLTSHLHPEGKGTSKRLRKEIADILAARIAEAASPQQVLTGIDVLEREAFARLRNKRVGLVAHKASVDAKGRRTIDLLHRAPGVTLVSLFSPEHGLSSDREGAINDSHDEATGLVVHSLYGKNRRPDPTTLERIDVLVYDLQDAGARFYTYISTLGYLLEAVSAKGIELMILDRPNPIGGIRVEGPLPKSRESSFIAYHPIPVRHGMTVGELGRMFNEERKVHAKLEVVKLEGYRRDLDFDQTRLPFVAPSPNLRSVTEELLYPGVALLETSNVSVGRGTTKPFEELGAPWIDGERLAATLRKKEVPGVRFTPVEFVPTSSPFAKERCRGVAIHIEDRARFSPLVTGLTLAQALAELHGKAFHAERLADLLGDPELAQAITRGEPVKKVLARIEPELERFRARRARYLLYPAPTVW